MKQSFSIGDGRRIGPGEPCYVIAEAGVNHNGDLDLAKQLVKAAAEAGADAVKFQTFKAKALVSDSAPKAEYQKRSPGGGDESQLEMLERLELDAGAHEQLIGCAQEAGIDFLSSPFDEESAALLAKLGLRLLKLGSGELTNPPLLRAVASAGVPLVLSTGMATLAEVETAVEVVRETGLEELAILHCVSCYPADPADANLRAMDTLAETFGVPIGYSDHCLGNEVTLASVARGACVVEKHLTLDCAMPGPDHAASSEPKSFCALVDGIRLIESALGTGEKVPAPAELEIAAVARKSLVAAADLSTGTVLSEESLELKRPGTGLPPASLPDVLGRVLARDLKEGQPLVAEDLEESA